jgi:hypothetical protein
VLTSHRDFDYRIDMTLHRVAEEGNRYFEAGVALDLQIRSTTQGEISEGAYHYDLDVVTYNRLRISALGTPRILVVLFLPQEEAAWTEQTESSLELRRCAYWISLRGGPETANTASIRIAIPRANVFSTESVHRLMDQINRGDYP